MQAPIPDPTGYIGPVSRQKLLRPPGLVILVSLFWVIQICHILIGDMPQSQRLDARVIDWIIMATICGTIFLFHNAMLQGRNWAKIVSLLITVFGAASMSGPAIDGSWPNLADRIFDWAEIAEAVAWFIYLTRPGVAIFFKETPEQPTL